METVQSRIEGHPVTASLTKYWTRDEVSLLKLCTHRGPTPTVNIPSDSVARGHYKRVTDALHLFAQAVDEWPCAPTGPEEMKAFGYLRLFQANIRNLIKTIYRSAGEANPNATISAFYESPAYKAYKKIADPIWKGSKRYKTQHAAHERKRYAEDEDYCEAKKASARDWDASEDGKAARKAARAKSSQKSRKARNAKTYRARVRGAALVDALRDACRYEPQSVEPCRKAALAAMVDWLMLKGEDQQRATINAGRYLQQVISQETATATMGAAA